MIWQTRACRIRFTIRDNHTAIILFLGVRVLVLLALWMVTGGSEVASDARLQRMLVESPLAVLLGEAPHDIASYAPLQGVLLYPLQLPLSALPAMIAIRLPLVLIEATSFLALLALTRRRALAPTIDRAWRWLFVLGPHQILLATVFVQDETIAQCAMLIAAVWLASGHTVAAQWALAGGMLFGKVFLLLPAAFLLLLRGDRARQLVPLALVVVVQSVPFLAAEAGANLPYVGFSPDAVYGSTVWALHTGESPAAVATLKRISLASAAFALAALALAWLLRARRVPVDSMTLLGVPVALFLLPFYQHNPEYLAIAWPVAVLAWRRVATIVTATAIVAAAWLPNILYGLRHVGTDLASTADARNRLLGPWIARFDVDFTVLHALSVQLYTVAYALLVAALIVRSLSRRADPPPRARGAAG